MGWTPPVRGSKLPLVRDANHGRVTKGAHPMSNVTIAVDTAKNVTAARPLPRVSGMLTHDDDPGREGYRLLGCPSR
jgi:hypothetical protein